MNLRKDHYRSAARPLDPPPRGSGRASHTQTPSPRAAPAARQRWWRPMMMGRGRGRSVWVKPTAGPSSSSSAAAKALVLGPRDSAGSLPPRGVGGGAGAPSERAPPRNLQGLPLRAGSQPKPFRPPRGRSGGSKSPRGGSGTARPLRGAPAALSTPPTSFFLLLGSWPRNSKSKKS